MKAMDKQQKQKNYMQEDRARTKMMRGFDDHEKRMVYRVNADYRIAEQPDTARLLVREMHGMLSRAEAKQLADLRANLIQINMMCDGLVLAED